ncbi:hypothetical protein LJR289_001452 [Pseudoduganella sp. LjRoot289]|uniref:hypothetical protein n=1 Tax=Pseudoduganella sp. LjRoot289 TaxID=3342314 RepID=UPI003ED065DB
MKWITLLAASGLIASSALAPAAASAAAATPAATAAAGSAAPSAAQVKAAHDLLASMQAEKLTRTVAGGSKFGNEQQRLAFMAKLDKVPADQVYSRLAAPVARLVSAETAAEMTRFYQSTYGQKVLYKAYNGGPSMYDEAPKPTPAEKAELAKPAYVKADKEFQAAKPAIRHEVFVLVSELSKAK